MFASVRETWTVPYCQITLLRRLKSALLVWMRASNNLFRIQVEQTDRRGKEIFGKIDAGSACNTAKKVSKVEPTESSALTSVASNLPMEGSLLDQSHCLCCPGCKSKTKEAESECVQSKWQRQISVRKSWWLTSQKPWICWQDSPSLIKLIYCVL